MIDYQAAYSRLATYGQEHVLRWWSELDDAAKSRLWEQIAAVDLDWLKRVFASDIQPVAPEEIHPYREVIERGDPQEREAILLGEEALRAGRVGTLLVAGGQGTRLGFDGPKGCFPIGAVSGKTLYQILSERQLALGRRYGRVPPLYLMTSDANHQVTLELFGRANRFGLPEEDVLIFQQGLAPAIDERGRLLMEAPGRLLLAPNGNGGAFAALEKSGALADMRRRGVEVLSYVHVDNPLSRSCDPRFVGYHLLRRSQFSCKAIPKRGAAERVGCYASVRGRLQIVEYTELPEELARLEDERGELVFRYSNPGLFLWSREFVESQAQRRDLPFHKAHKKLPHLDEQGRLVSPKEPCGYKLEAFAMDTLPDAERSLCLACEREEEFAPVKNAEGADSPASARELMTRLFASWVKRAGGRVELPDGAHLEVSPLFALDEDELEKKLPPGFAATGDCYLG